MHRPEFFTPQTAPLAPLTPTRPTAPVMPAASFGSSASPGTGFSRSYAELRAEIDRFIADGSPAAATDLPTLSAEDQAARAAIGLAAGAPLPADARAFAEELMPLAQAAAQRLGVAPELVLAQAALETSWGRQPLRQADGATTHNLFGIKATGGWQGEVAEAATTEYEAGSATPRRENFRSYPNPGAAFDDFAGLLLNNPRYRGALNTGSDAMAYASALQRGGYATDPSYASKLVGVVERLRAAQP